jgi:hypothetical protein
LAIHLKPIAEDHSELRFCRISFARGTCQFLVIFRNCSQIDFTAAAAPVRGSRRAA